MRRAFHIALNRRIGSHPRWRQGLLIAGGAGVVGIVAIGAVGVWLAVSAIRYVGQVDRSPILESKIQGIREQASGLMINLAPCWQTVQAMLSPQAWIAKPVTQNLQALQLACIEGSSRQSVTQQEVRS